MDVTSSAIPSPSTRTDSAITIRRNPRSRPDDIKASPTKAGRESIRVRRTPAYLRDQDGGTALPRNCAGPQPLAGEQVAGLLLRDRDLSASFSHNHVSTKCLSSSEPTATFAMD